MLFTPWLKGERAPVDDRMARAVLEGVAHNTRWLLDAAERFTSRRLDPLRVIGGGAQSDLWCQVLADVTDHTVQRACDPLLPGLRGAALGAGLALGEIVAAQVQSLVPTDHTFVPTPATRATYDQALSQSPRLYRGQRSIFRRLNSRDQPA